MIITTQAVHLLPSLGTTSQRSIKVQARKVVSSINNLTDQSKQDTEMQSHIYVLNF